MIWATIKAAAKSWTTWALVGLAVVVLFLVGMVKQAKAEVAKQKDRAARWEKTAELEAEKAQRARDLSAQQDKIRKDKDEKVRQVTAVLDKQRADAEKVSDDARARVARAGSAAAEAKRLREEIDLEDGGL